MDNLIFGKGNFKSDSKGLFVMLPLRLSSGESTTHSSAYSLPVGSTVTLRPECLDCVQNPAMARRLCELGIRPGACLTLGAHVAGGARIVTVDTCRYAIDRQTLQSIGV
nr:hypothetical protein CE91St29_05770 [Corynebacterium striatum]